MSVTAEQVLTDALTLTEDDRFEIAEALMASIYQDREMPIDPELLALLEKREADWDSGAATTLTWEEVKQRARSLTDA